MVEMVEIGAGGGSIARVDGMGRVTVGPDSAGAVPGPACYAQDGEAATVTDADLQLGRIDPTYFAGGEMALNGERANQALVRDVGKHLGEDASNAAWMVSEIVDENMSNAARVHAVERGRSLSGRTMIAFGGAAPLHAARMAEKLGIKKIIVPIGAGVGSAIGFLRAPISYEVVRSYFTTLSGCDLGRVNDMLEEMSSEAENIVRPASTAGEFVDIRTADMRYVGQGHEIGVHLPCRRLLHEDLALLRKRFDEAYCKQYGRTIPGVDVEVLSWTVTLSEPPLDVTLVQAPILATEINSEEQRKILDGRSGKFQQCAIVRRSNLENNMGLTGPALIVEEQTTTYVPKDFSAAINSLGYIILSSGEQDEEQ